MRDRPELDPGAVEALRILREVYGDDLDALPLDQLRALNEREAVLGRAPTPAFVADVEDRAIARPDGSELSVRTYRPVTDGPLPLLLFMHGGGWCVGSLDTVDHVCRRIAAGGAAVVSVGYRLAPEHRHPAALDDCALAARWAHAHAAELGGDPALLLVGGESAGGNLAAALALRLREDADVALAGQLLIYPALDPACATASHRELSDDERVPQTVAGFESIWRQYVAHERDLDLPTVAPARASALAGLPPALILTAELDLLRDEAIEYGARLSAAAVEARVRTFDGQVHGFVTLDGPCAVAAAEAHAEIAAWLRERARAHSTG